MSPREYENDKIYRYHCSQVTDHFAPQRVTARAYETENNAEVAGESDEDQVSKFPLTEQ